MPPPAFDSDFWPDFVGQGYSRERVFRTLTSPEANAGDQTAQMGGNNILFRYALAWRNLTRSQAEAMIHAQDILRGGAGWVYFLEWPQTSESNVLIGTGTGAGDITFDVQAYMPDIGSLNSLQITVGIGGPPLFEPADFTVAAVTGSNYTEHTVTILAAENVLDAEYYAFWTARRRRKVALEGPLKIQEKQGSVGGSNRWNATANLLETEAAT